MTKMTKIAPALPSYFFRYKNLQISELFPIFAPWIQIYHNDKDNKHIAQCSWFLRHRGINPPADRVRWAADFPSQACCDIKKTSQSVFPKRTLDALRSDRQGTDWRIPVGKIRSMRLFLDTNIFRPVRLKAPIKLPSDSLFSAQSSILPFLR